MSEKKAKEVRTEVAGVTDEAMQQIAKDVAPAVTQLVSDTNVVIQQMKDTWPLEDRIQFCKWFLDVETVEQMAESMGMVPIVDNPAQTEMDFGDEEEGTVQ